MSGQKSKARRVLLIIFSIIVAITVIAVVFIVYQKLKQPSKSALDAIPTDSPMIIKINDPKTTWYQDVSTTDFWKEISAFEKMGTLNASIKWLDSLTHTDALVSKIVSEQPLYISMNSASDSAITLLFSLEIPQEFTVGTANFLASIAKANKLKETMQNEVAVWENSQPNGFSFYQHQGVFAGSFDIATLKKSAKQIVAEKGLKNDKLFTQISVTEGKKSNISVYLNFNQISACLTPAFNQNFSHIVQNINSVDGWGNYDILFRKDLLLASGYISIGEKSFLSTIKDATKQNASFAKLIDEKTFYVYSMCISNFENFNAQRNEYFKKAGVDEPKEERDSINGSDANSVWTRINPIQLIASASTYSDSSQWLLTVKPLNIIEATKCLIDEVTGSSKNQNSTDTLNYKSFTIGKLNLGNSAQLFGKEAFAHIQISYFSIGEEFIQFAAKKEVLTKNIDRITDGKTLESSYIFKSFAHDINPEALLMVYFSPFEGSEWIKGRFNESTPFGRLIKQLTKKTPYVGFKIGELQNQYFSTSICWKYLINSTVETDAKSEEEKPVVSKPEKKKNSKKEKKGSNKKIVKKETKKGTKSTVKTPKKKK
jgi:hypothetical protein